MSVTTTLSEATLLHTHVRELFEKQRAHKQLIRNTSAAQRIEKLKRIKVWMLENQQQIQQALYQDFRKPAAEVDSTEIYAVKMEIEHTIAHLQQWMKPKKVPTPLALMGASSQVLYEPKGVALIMAPWNFPFNLVLIPLVSAIAAGCCSIVKPSEITPNTSALLKKMLGELFDENEIAVVEGDSEVATALLKLPFDHIFFTGSPAIGKIVMKAAAEHLTSVTLELGGKSPVIVDETANTADAAEKITWGKFLNCGQICVAPDYLFVHRSKEKELVEAICSSIQKLYAGTNKELVHSADYARMVNARHRSRVQRLLEEAVAHGAVVATGGDVIENENFIAPTVLTHINPTMQLMQEEIFGPVLPVLSYDSLDEVIAFINQRDTPLAFYVFSQNKASINKILQHTSSGGVCINECILHVGSPYLPFGGVNSSGIGKAHGHYGFLAFSNERAVLKQRIGFTSAKMLYPPYTEKKKKLTQLIMKWF